MIAASLMAAATGASFLPSDIAGLRLWLESDHGITVDGSNNVTAWSDRSPQANHAIPNLAPYILAPAQFGSLPGLTGYTGGQNMKSLVGTNIWTHDSPRTIFVVASQSVSDAKGMFLQSPISGSDGEQGLTVGTWNYADLGTTYITLGFGSAQTSSKTPSQIGGGRRVYTWQWEGPGNPGTLLIDGVNDSLSSTPIPSETVSTPGYNLGYYFTPSTQYGSFDSVLGGFLCYDSVLSPTDVAAVLGYLGRYP